MPVFHPDNKRASERSKRYYARSELLYTLVDFGAALSFVVGSILFFWEATTGEATWMFLIGSILFAAKPTIRTWREVHLWREGDLKDLAERDR